MQRKSTINNYSKSYLNKNRSDTNALLTFDFDSYIDRLIFQSCAHRTKNCVRFVSQTSEPV